MLYYACGPYPDDRNGGSGTTVDSTHAYDAEKALTKNAFSKKNYTFVGWNTKADGSGKTYSDGVNIKNLASENGAVITLYAQWERTVYTKTTLDPHGNYTICNVQIYRATAPCQVIIAAYSGSKLVTVDYS